MSDIIQVKGLTARLHQLYMKLKDWYLNLPQEELEALRKSKADLIASIEFFIAYLEGEENG